jgi:hypothetical protein
VGRFIGCLAIVTLAAACQIPTQPAPTPSPAPSPHSTPLAAVLQQADVPAGLESCLASGPIDGYLTTEAGANPSVGAAASAEWTKLRGDGATAAAISIFAADSSACTAELGATVGTKAATSFVAVFDNPGQADRAWSAGVFGFAPPAVGEAAPGITRGSATGLGLSSFTYVSGSVMMACWHHSVFVALVILAHLDAGAFKSATAAVDARLN